MIIPPTNETSAGSNNQKPVNGTWFITEDIVRIEGGVVEDSGLGTCRFVLLNITTMLKNKF